MHNGSLCDRAAATSGRSSWRADDSVAACGNACSVCRVTQGLQAALQGGWVAEGTAAVQDAAAALVVAAALAPLPGDAILDACAAPGGKALFAAARMRDMHSAAGSPAARSRAVHSCGTVLASDISAARAGLVRQAAAAWGLSDCVAAAAADLRAVATPACAPVATSRVRAAPAMTEQCVQGL
jgi:16S rRNA C967 or C1407 C5-methylase (RsmB/RsmF family)